MRNATSLAIFVLLTAAAATFGALFMPGPWYAALAKPSWTPPNWLFGPVWTVLYIAIAIAGWLAWRVRGAGAAVVLWVAGLAANGLWSFLFFGAHRVDLALLDIGLLLILIAAFIVSAWNTSRPAALLFVPYFAWVAFATALNAAIWQLNG